MPSGGFLDLNARSLATGVDVLCLRWIIFDSSPLLPALQVLQYLAGLLLLLSGAYFCGVGWHVEQPAARFTCGLVTGTLTLGTVTA